MELTFTNETLAGLCNHQDELIAWAGDDDSAALDELLFELDAADTLGRLEELPHVFLRRAPQGRVGAHGGYEAGVLLQPQVGKSKNVRDAEAALVVAVAVGSEEFNPEGAAWPRAFAMSRTTQ